MKIGGGALSEIEPKWGGALTRVSTVYNKPDMDIRIIAPYTTKILLLLVLRNLKMRSKKSWLTYVFAIT